MHRTVIKNFQSQLRVKILVKGRTSNEEFIGIVHDEDVSGIYFIPEGFSEMLITWGSLLRIEKIKE